ncbi:MAG: carbamoyltransferase [Candidatus Omnitrophica bacterium]|nr:carbamoyltransferase [Candidatus Omnitrophota bacterium]
MKPTYILGISAFYHDSAAVLLKDGEILAACQEERFTRIKHDHNFPENSINYCLKEAGISSSGLDFVAFYDKPFIKFERLLETYIAFAPSGIRSFLKAMPLWIKQKLFLKDYIKEKIGFNGKILFPEHHESHAASAFFPSPFKDAAILTIDGVGEWATASYGIGENNRIKIDAELKFPHSLGLLYSAFTYYAGFKVNSGEYKLMGLGPYGEPKYTELILKELVDLKGDGSLKINMKYFDYCAGLTMTNKKFNALFGSRPRRPGEKIEQRHMDIARSIQAVTEKAVLNMGRHVYDVTKKKNLCLAGGVALNCVANGKLLREGPFDNIWIQPAASDAGGALGTALCVWHSYLNKERKPDGINDSQKASLLGPGFSDAEIEEFLKSRNIPHLKLNPEYAPKKYAEVIANQKVLGWFQGRMEFGPRALGSRSIFADPRSSQMQSIMNVKIKFRESFRPFAPTVLKEHAKDYFDISCESPYMLLVAQVKNDKRLNISEEEKRLQGLDKLKVKRSVIPAVTHVDYSARVQTVKRQDNPAYYDMINEFFKLTGCPIVINTSFNVRGEPIVCTPQDAYMCFMRTNMDYLAMGSFLMDKSKQPASEIKTGDLTGIEPD